MYEKILVAIDGSEGSFKALKQAVSLCTQFKSSLFIVTAIRHHNQREISLSMVRPNDPSTIDDSLKEYSKTIIENSKQYAKEKGVKKVTGFNRIGRPAVVITEYAKKKGVHLTVIGRHGTHLQNMSMLGSVSQRVVGLSTCPVLVV